MPSTQDGERVTITGDQDIALLNSLERDGLLNQDLKKEVPGGFSVPRGALQQALEARQRGSVQQAVYRTGDTTSDGYQPTSSQPPPAAQEAPGFWDHGIGYALSVPVRLLGSLLGGLFGSNATTTGGNRYPLGGEWGGSISGVPYQRPYYDDPYGNDNSGIWQARRGIYGDGSDVLYPRNAVLGGVLGGYHPYFGFGNGQTPNPLLMNLFGA